MNAQRRRQQILTALRSSDAPVSAGTLAERFGVSRQIVVGDVALLRASGEDITATPRGYTLGGGDGSLVRTLACIHSPEDMERELNIMVDNGCTVRDVVVEHPVYGQLTGALDLRSRYDVRHFIERSSREEAKPLCLLTGGAHLHTLLCPDEEAFSRVRQELAEAGILIT